jgi:hypothetical protein
MTIANQKRPRARRHRCGAPREAQALASLQIEKAKIDAQRRCAEAARSVSAARKGIYYRPRASPIRIKSRAIPVTLAESV